MRKSKKARNAKTGPRKAPKKTTPKKTTPKKTTPKKTTPKKTTPKKTVQKKATKKTIRKKIFSPKPSIKLRRYKTRRAFSIIEMGEKYKVKLYRKNRVTSYLTFDALVLESLKTLTNLRKEVTPYIAKKAKKWTLLAVYLGFNIDDYTGGIDEYEMISGSHNAVSLTYDDAFDYFKNTFNTDSKRESRNLDFYLLSFCEIRVQYA